MKDIELVLMHEGTHIVRRDNLGKKLALLIVLVNWFNPILRLYLDDLDAWGDISCVLDANAVTELPITKASANNTLTPVFFPAFCHLIIYSTLFSNDCSLFN